MELVIYNVLYYINGSTEAIQNNEETKPYSKGSDGNTCWYIIDACNIN